MKIYHSQKKKKEIYIYIVRDLISDTCCVRLPTPCPPPQRIWGMRFHCSQSGTLAAVFPNGKFTEEIPQTVAGRQRRSPG